MPITIRWYDDTKTIVVWEFSGQWTLDELHAIYTESHNMCQQVPENSVIALVDMTGSHLNGVPSHIFSTLAARRRTQAANFDMIVIVTNSTLIKVFITTMSKMPALHDQFAIFVTHQEALTFIEKRRVQQEADKAQP